ncbi:uncharacterized protein PRCAT00002927001 [Priceomyces carsonii]|uniref:uncharacterized protein n=1 Tax=Priceomyces carsonii TaxID=28549 RepID=UPI002ED9507B|nr:unnamed protein product [Priceomyces carsonii]
MTSERQKTALVTGASSGIGFATAIEFSKRGYKVFAGARRLSAMEKLKDYGIIIFKLDVTSLESIKESRKLIEEETNGYLDVLYNNAGQSCTFPALDVQDEWFKMCYDVNVFGPMRMVREFIPLLIKAHGTIGFTGSVSGLLPFPFSSIYSSSKAAIHLYAATLRLELKPLGVKVINIVTGGVKTDIEEKRSLPSTSIYNVEGIDVAMIERKQMAKRNNPMEPGAYAYKVVNDFEAASPSGKLNIYRGKMATYLSWISILVPRFILEAMFIRKFKLSHVFKILELKYKKKRKGE